LTLWDGSSTFLARSISFASGWDEERSFNQFRSVEVMPSRYKGSRLLENILGVVDDQMRDNLPPETRKTFDRLLKEGHTQTEAKRLIGCALSAEIYDVLKHEREFDRRRYTAYLGKLPRMPWGS
jgi:hypothetical protein